MNDASKKTRKELIWQAQAREGSADLSTACISTRVTAAVLFGLATMLRPFGQLRIGLLHHQAMGRLYGNTEYFLRLRAFRSPNRREIVTLISGPRPVNGQILKMLKRRVRVFESGYLRRVLEDIRQHSFDHPIWIDLECTGWLRGSEWYDPGPQLSFTAEEHARGQSILRELGVREGQQHVCVFAKDKGYSDNPDNPPDPDGFWAKNDFRNCDIYDFVPALEFLAGQGFKVFRMGIHAPEAMLPDGLPPEIVDYTAKVRPTLDDPDFVDTYLQATCKFFVGCTSGVYILSAMFDRPIASTNMVPYGECGRGLRDIFLVKTCRDRASGDLIPIPRLIEMGLDADWLTQKELEDLDQAGIEFVDNSPEEILELVQEMNLRIDGRWIEEPDDEALQARFREISPTKCFDGKPFPGRPGAAFLRRYRALLAG